MIALGERVLLTGTSSGIGLATAVECAAAGHAVVATMRDASRASALEEAAREAGVTIAIEELDVTAPDTGDRVRELVAKHGGFGALVNNAGIGVLGPFEEQSEDDVRSQIETNVLGVLAVTRAILPSMREAGRGRIVNVSSLSGRISPPLISVYAATKHAVEGFSESLRWEVEPFGVRVTTVAPGMVKTPMFFEGLRRASLRSDTGPYAAMREALEKKILAGAQKGLGPEAVGAVIARVLSDPSPPHHVPVGAEARVLSTLRRVMPERLMKGMMRRAFATKHHARG